MELRRWPGDTVVSIYSIAGGLTSAGADAPPVYRGRFDRSDSGVAGWEQWVGTVETAAGPRRALWLERDVEGAPAHMAALLLPGDAGLGSAGIDDLELEAFGLLPRLEINLRAWRARSGVPAGATVLLPKTATTSGDKTENDAPWQVVRGRDFTVGLPPGIRARRMDGSVPPPTEIEGGRMWIRGRFVDEEGSEVIVGDDRSFGYLAEVKPLTDAWVQGKQAPLGAPGARAVGGESFNLAAERTRARSARAERWSEPGFAGEWLVFRLRFEERGIEIGLPVIRGTRSPSLYWIPVTWRPSDRSPAPPPVDPAQRFGIRFERLRRSDQQRHPWTEGYLQVPGLRVEVPKNWFPAAALRSATGYPIRLVHRSGVEVGRLIRLAATELPAVDAEGSDWESVPRRGGEQASAIYRRSDGALLLVAREGHAFLFEPGTGEVPDRSEMWRRMLESLRLMRSER